MFKKVVSLCLSAAVAVSMGVVARAEMPGREDFSAKDCRSICAVKSNFKNLLDKKIELIHLLMKNFEPDIAALSGASEALKDPRIRETVLRNILKEKSSGKSAHSKEDLKAASGLASDENVGEFAVTRLIKPVERKLTAAVLELQSAADKLEKLKNNLDESVEGKCICLDDITGF